MRQRHLFHFILAALLAALTLVVTRISLPLAAGGYIHLGDAIIYLAVLILPTPYAVSAAVIGAGLADFTSGYAIYVLPTVLIKATMVLIAKKIIKKAKRSLVQNSLICSTGAITVVGYYFADVILTLVAGSTPVAAFTASLSAIPFNAIQALAAAGLFLFLAPIARKVLKLPL